MTTLYELTIPVRLAVEADNAAEARRRLDALWREVTEALPTGAGAFAKDAARAEHIAANMTRR